MRRCCARFYAAYCIRRCVMRSAWHPSNNNPRSQSPPNKPLSISTACDRHCTQPWGSSRSIGVRFATNYSWKRLRQLRRPRHRRHLCPPRPRQSMRQPTALTSIRRAQQRRHLRMWHAVRIRGVSLPLPRLRKRCGHCSFSRHILRRPPPRET